MRRILHKKLLYLPLLLLMGVAYNNRLPLLVILCFFATWDVAWSCGAESEKQKQKQLRDAELLIKKVIEDYKNKEG